MTQMNYDTAKKRFTEIREEIMKLQLEAEQLVIAFQDHPRPEGEGKCTYYYTCGCQGYVSGGAPAVCNRSHCGHYASEHEF